LSDGIGIKWIFFAQFPIDNILILFPNFHKFKKNGGSWEKMVLFFKVGLTAAYVYIECGVKT